MLPDPDPKRFYVTGGTLPTDAPSYIVRQADTDLFEGLRAGDFCYVLNTRQMGKSSLMVRTAARLRSSPDTAVCLLDLTAVGSNLTPSQWYFGLLSQAASQLDDTGEIEFATDEFWNGARDLGPMQRFFAAFESVLLPALPNGKARLIVFVDEIDATISLPFATDEFFAGLRECYNRRAANPSYNRLTFCLLGVTTPADLISDARMSPFNIGRRIRLNDFTLAEAAPLARHLPGGMATLNRAIHWTNGHPYLTQRLLRALVTEEERVTESLVDTVCQRLFLTRDARETDDNLTFVRNRLLRGGSDLAALLDLYRRIQQPTRFWIGSGGRIRDDETSPLYATLRLSGVVKTDAGGFLTVRNRIYDRVFDSEWTETHLPDAEQHRQRAAFRRGALRSAALGGVGVTAFGVLAGIALVQATEARRQTRLALERLSQRSAEEGVRLLTEGDPLAAVDALTEALRVDERSLPERAASARRRLAFAQRRIPHRIFEIPAGGAILAAEPSPDGGRFVTATEGGTVCVWDTATGKPLTREMRHTKAVRHAAFSPDGSRIATASEDGTGRVWDARTGEPLTAPLLYHVSQPAIRTDWSQDGRTLAISGSVGATLWNTVTGKEKSRIWDTDTGGPWNAEGGSRMETRAVAFAPNGRRVAFAASPYQSNFADPVTGKMNGVVGRTHVTAQIAYSPDGTRILQAGSFDGVPGRTEASNGAAICDANSGRILALLPHRDYGTDARFSPDGTRIATASRDGTARVWDCRTGKPLLPPLAHNGGIVTIRFREDGKRLLTACQDGTAQLWDAITGKAVGPPLRHPAPLRAAFFSPDGRRILTACSDGFVRLWKLPETDSDGRRIGPVPPLPGTTANGSISMGAKRTFVRQTAPGNSAARFTSFDVATGKQIAVFPSPDMPPGHGAALLNKSGSRVAFIQSTRMAVWDLAAGRRVLEMNLPEGHLGGSLVQEPEGERIYLRLSQDRVQSLDAQTGKALSPPWTTSAVVRTPFDGKLHPLPFKAFMEHITPSNDWRYVLMFPPPASPASRLTGADAIFWDVMANTTHPLKVTWKDMYHLRFSPRNRFFLFGANKLYLWNTKTATIRELPIKKGTRILSSHFSPDERRLATGTDDGMARLWDTTTGKLVLPPIAHRGTVVAVAFSQDGALATASGEGTIHLWDIRTGERLTSPLHLASPPQELAFTEDGRFLVAAGGREARCWDVGTVNP